MTVHLEPETVANLGEDMTEGLKPCPFCGDPMFNDWETFGHTDSNLPCIIAKQAWGATERSITAWNTRPSDEAVIEKLERVIYMNCDPFDATEKDAAIIREIAKRQFALEAPRKQG